MEIVAHNEATPAPSYTRAINHMSDRTIEELQSMKGLDRSLLHHQRALDMDRRRRLKQEGAIEIDLAALPSRLDWREKGVVTPVKNQGSCGSCWTFASAETLESQWAIATGRLQELSEQFILDCTPNPHECGGTGGCGGGTAELAYGRLKTLGGLPSEWTYPYVSILGNASTCHGVPLPLDAPHSGVPAIAANVTGHVSTTPNSYEELINNLVTKGPLAVSVDASSWHDYAGGVFDGGNHTNPDLDHLVQLVGYGTDDKSGYDYWLIRNSWTPEWGENGFIRLRRHDPTKGATAPCGVDITPLDGNGCKGGPQKVKVCGQSGILYDGVYPLVK